MMSHKKFIFRGAFGGGLSERKKIQSGVWCSTFTYKRVLLRHYAKRVLTCEPTVSRREIGMQMKRLKGMVGSSLNSVLNEKALLGAFN